MTGYLFPPTEPVAVAVAGNDKRFPVRRIFCVGRNYAAHVREMGFDPQREAPCYFTKSAQALVESGATVPYPPGTSNLHHEIELVVALGSYGENLVSDDALNLVYGYAAGLDMTRRDLQLASRSNQGPWDIGKDFENAAVIGAIQPATTIGHPDSGRIALTVNDETRQESDLDKLIWSAPEIIAHLSQYYRLRPGDLIFTGTPDGVGPVIAGDTIAGEVEGVGEVRLTIAP